MERITENLCTLINYNTTTDEGSTKACAAFIAESLSQAGIRVAEYDPGHQVYGLIPGRGKGTILLHAHMDTAPYERDSGWRVPPDRASVRKECITGRGALDCKGQIAVWIRLMQEAAGMCVDGMLPGASLAILVTDREEMGGEDGLGALIGRSPELFSDVRLVIGEGGGYPFYYRNRLYYTLQTGELEDGDKDSPAMRSSVRLEEVLRLGVDRGYYLPVILDYARDWPDLGSRKLDMDLPLDALIAFFRNAPCSDLIRQYGEAFASSLQSVLPGAGLMPWITPGYSDNRWFRKLGIPVAGFFPLDQGNALSGIHGANEYISIRSLKLAYSVMTCVLHRLLKHDPSFSEGQDAYTASGRAL